MAFAMRLLLALLLAFVASVAQPLSAAVSDPVRGIHVEGRLITAEHGVSGRTLSAGLDLRLDPGWKTYWRSPGQVGLPPALDWSGSTNLTQADMAYPAPARFTAFDIENYGYEDRVLFPLTLRVADPSQPATLRLRADILVCADICIPETLEMTLDLPMRPGLDEASAADLANWVARVPGMDGFAAEAVHVGTDALTMRVATSEPSGSPQIFPEFGPAAFGPPDIRPLPDGGGFWARLPILSPGEGPLDLTFVDGTKAATLRVEAYSATPVAPPGQMDGGLFRILALALLGGLILNVMPCVLPVLSIKLARALDTQGKSARAVRLSFLTTAAGILGFFVALAFALIAARAAGAAVGWGVQFQQPVFLAVLVMLMVLFVANLWGAFEFRLSSGAQTAMGRAGGEGRLGDFATGGFAALMATPCSAPFLGTAVTYALTQGPLRTVVVFLALGLGLALPYLAVALYPAAIRLLPRPGRWMVTLRRALGVLMLMAAIWILSVLWSAAGPWMAGAVTLVAGAVLLALMRVARPIWLGGTGVMLAVILALIVPQAAPREGDADEGWATFDAGQIGPLVAAGQVVFVDVTADWCLTCQANKRLVLDRDTVRAALEPALRMQADWTRPDADIADFLATHDRYGIPFNIVFGPGAPGGVVLPELLTEATVLEGLARASGS